ncbi:MAG: molybdopterin-dependent oxidoreductase, partial [Chloroflexota bacterium]
MKIGGAVVEVQPLWEMYKLPLRDYGLETVAEITGVAAADVERLAKDIATTTPVSIHQGEGINHWFHATEANRAAYLPLMLTGNIGKPGAGCHTWAGNYKSALFQGTPATGPGFEGWIYEDPFAPQLDPAAHGRTVRVKKYAKGEEPAYWNRGDTPLAVETPKAGRKMFTGSTHMPTPTKVIWATNVNLLNNAKWAYEILRNVNPRVDCIVTQDIEMTASCEYSDLVLPANSWLEFEGLEVTASCSNPFLQIWKGGIRPLYDTKDDVVVYAEVARALAAETGDRRFTDHWRFEIEGKREVYIQRLLETSATTADYRLEDIMAGKYGEPGAALMLFRTLPRVPFYEQIHDGIRFYSDTGRLYAYC